MAPSLALLLWAAILLDPSSSTLPSKSNLPPDISNPSFMRECVQMHNQYRARVNPSASNMYYMTWDEALAKSARAWARNCKFFHNPLLQSPRRVHPSFSPVGENIWAGSPSSFNISKVIQDWNNEVAHYTYATMSCSRMCGHYTQVVWAKSYKVGCAVHMCSSIEGYSASTSTVFVCNYGEAGNMKGVHPYESGQPCSACPQGTCENNLCRDPKGEELKSYSWDPDWVPSAATSGSSDSTTSLATAAATPLLLILWLLHPDICVVPY